MYVLGKIKEVLSELIFDLGFDAEERLVPKEEFMKKIGEIDDYDKIVSDLAFVGDEIREEKKKSYIASVAEFLESWKGGDTGFIRYLKIDKDKNDNILLSYRCLDPSVMTKDIVENAHSVIMMSGTLTPTYMYRDLIGFSSENLVEKEYESPFPEENRLALIIPETSTKFTARNEEQYKRIAEISADVANSISGNCAIFFPSYYLKDRVAKYFNTIYTKSIFSEDARMTSSEKQILIEKFKGYEKVGSCLLAVASGSFGEGIDLPGDLLKGVIVVGLPLNKPDLETKELIAYYDKKFKKGWDYGYILPAITKTLQNAGRCIRTETDKGIVAFLDERYTWPMYFRCFPSEWNLKVKVEFEDMIAEFFNSKA